MSESSHPITPPPQPQGPQRRRDLGEFGRWLRSQGLVRPAAQPVAGVSAAVATRFGLDVTLVRVLMVVLGVLLTPAAYGLAWLLLPDSENHILLEDLINGQVSAGTVGGGLLLLVGLPGGGAFSFGDRQGGPPVLVLAALALGVWWFLAGRSRRHQVDHPVPGAGAGDVKPTYDQHPNPGPYPHQLMSSDQNYDVEPSTAYPAASANAQQGARATATPLAAPSPVVGSRPALPWQATAGILGAAAIVAGVVALLAAGTGDLARADAVGRAAAIFAVSAAAAAAVFGLAMVGSGLAGRRAGWVTALGVLSTALALGAISSAPNLDVGNRTYAPSVAQDTTVDHGVGNLDVDLTGTRPLPTGDAPTTNLDLGIGNTSITVSDGLAVDVILSQGLGNIDGLRDTDDPQRIGREDGPPDLILNVDMGIGNLTVEEVQS